MLALRSVRLRLRMTGEKVAGLPRFARNDGFEVSRLLRSTRNHRFEVSGLPRFARNDRKRRTGLLHFVRNDGGRGLVAVNTHLSIHLFFDVFLLEDLLFFYFFVKLS